MALQTGFVAMEATAIVAPYLEGLLSDKGLTGNEALSQTQAAVAGRIWAEVRPLILADKSGEQATKELAATTVEQSGRASSRDVSRLNGIRSLR